MLSRAKGTLTQTSRGSMSIAKINTVRLQNLSWAFTQSAVLFAAIEADFFSKISEGLDTEQKLEEAVGSGAPWGKPCFGRSPSPDSATTASSRSRPRALITRRPTASAWGPRASSCVRSTCPA